MFGDKLRALRKENKVSQKMLAEHFGLTQQAVAKWESGGASPDPDTLRRIADFFDTTADALLEMPGATPFPAAQRRQALVPVLGSVRAGWGALAYEEELGREVANVKDPSQYFYLVVKGNSMAPRIQDGDLALVHKQDSLDNGDLGVIVYGDEEGTLKKFVRRDNTVVLQPFNPAFQPQVITGEDLDHLYIAGKVVETKTKW